MIYIQDRRDTVFLRFLAIFLIANSHLDSLYPFPQLATGGALGNALFFMLSGYGLALSEQKKERPFLRWYGRRIARIYPSLVLVVIAFHFWLWGGWRTWKIADYLTAFIWPTPAWFISALMIFYIILFLIMKMKKPGIYLIGMVLLLVPYLYFYATFLDLSLYTIEGPGYFKWIFYLQVMLFGGYLAHSTINNGRLGHFFLLLLCLIAYYSLLFMIKLGHWGQLQAFVHVLTMPIIYLTFMLSRSWFVLCKVMASGTLFFIISLIAGLTLEIYLLQGPVYANKQIQLLAFPVNISAFWIAVIVLSLLTQKAAGLLRRLR